MSFWKLYAKQLEQNFMWCLLFTLCTTAFIIWAPDVFATQSFDQDDPIGTTLCNMIKMFQGNTAKAIAVVGIIALGIQTLRGQLKWEVALVTITAIVILFKAPAIVSMISGDSAIVCGTNNNNAVGDVQNSLK